jgi:hypothetical protein
VTQRDFIPLLESELSMLSAGVAYDRAQLLEWAEAMRPHIDDDPDAGRWAREFAAVKRGETREYHRVECSGGAGQPMHAN